MRTLRLPYYDTIVCVAYDLPQWIPTFLVRHIDQYPVNTLNEQVNVSTTNQDFLPWKVTDLVPPY